MPFFRAFEQEKRAELFMKYVMSDQPEKFSDDHDAMVRSLRFRSTMTYRCPSCLHLVVADSEVFGCGFVQSYLSEESKSVAHLSTRLNEEEEDGDHEQVHVEGQRDPETLVDHEDEPPARASNILDLLK